MKAKKVLICGLSASLVLSASAPALALYRNENTAIIQTKSDGVIPGQYYLPSSVENINWGRLPNKYTKMLMSVPSGSTITVDTLSHEGMLEDQGRDPVKYFGQYGVAAEDVLGDAKAITASDKQHDFDNDGPHIVTGPIEVQGAEPGDVIKIEVLSLEPRVPYGVISNRHYKGALVGEFPENTERQEGASAAEPEKYGNVSKFAPIKQIDGAWYSYFEVDGKEVTYPIAPFLGIMGVATNTEEMLSSVPPTAAGGNLDINELGVGSTLYLPVEVEGAGVYVGDPHFAQGDGEVALTALEGSLRATIRVTLLEKGSQEIPGDASDFVQPFGETEEYWIPVGLDVDLDEAMKQSVRESIDFLEEQLGLDRDVAYAYLSAAVDYEVSQVVDKTKGIHALIPKIDFWNLLDVQLTAGGKTVAVTSRDQKLYVPLRTVIEALGGKVIWNRADASVDISVNGRIVKAKIGSNTYTVNGQAYVLDRAPQIVNGQTLIPTAALNEVFGVSVNWSTVGKTIRGVAG